MRKKNYLLLISFVLAMSACNTDRNDLIIQDLKNNNVDTSGLSSDTSGSNNSSSDNSGSSSSALGTQKISVTVIIAPAFTKPVTRVRVRAFTSRSPITASTWMDLTAGTTAGTFSGTYNAAPNPTQKFGLHVQAYNGSAKVGDSAGLETEYTNNGDGSTIVGNVITLTNAL